MLVPALDVKSIHVNIEDKTMAKKPSSDVDYRSAITGKFVKPEYAQTHPKTTVREVNKPSGSKKK
jgi:hypothetical protein